MRRTRIKGILNIPQRKRNDCIVKSEDVKKELDTNSLGVKNETPAPKSLSDFNSDGHVIAEDNVESPAVSENQSDIKLDRQPTEETVVELHQVSEIVVNEANHDLSDSCIENEKIQLDLVQKEVFPNETNNECSNYAQNNVIESRPVQTDIVSEVANIELPDSAVKNIGIKCEQGKKEGISIIENIVVSPSNSQPLILNSNESQISNGEVVETNSRIIYEKKCLPSRRRVIKPSVSVNAIKKRNEKQINTDAHDSARRLFIPEDTFARIEPENSNPVENLMTDRVSNTEVSESRVQVTSSPANINEMYKLNYSVDNKPEITKDASPETNAGSDSDCTPVPSSPTKMNRSRIKAIPKIGARKIAFGSKDLEEESRKTNSRTRNDSQSSNISSIQEAEQSPIPKPKEFSTIIRRKCKRTEWSKKLSDARKEFSQKFMDGKPDHKKLTMMDLIFYNPTTNIIKKENKEIDVKLNDEVVDDPDEPNEKSKEDEIDQQKLSDEENEIPAPQIKIGPDGQIIVDEKSLVIENKRVKKVMEEMQKSKMVDGNKDKYGVYKTFRRSKDWSHSETLRFYKALSTIGTDFSLMSDLFSNRTRRELKMKFKKEERINQTLVDKALMQPCSFDFEELKKEFELIDIERKVLEQQKIKDEKLRKTRQIKRSIKFVKLAQENEAPTAEPIETNSILTPEPTNIPEELCTVKKRQKKSRVKNSTKRIKQEKLDILNVLSSSDSESGDSYESEIINKPTHTRYGRKVRKRQIYEPDFPLDEEVIISRKIQPPVLESKESQKPGSIMMISSKTSDGQPVVQIYMVTGDNAQNNHGTGDLGMSMKNLMPIAMIKTGQTDDEEEEENIVENNFTIPADPVITSENNENQIRSDGEENNDAEVSEDIPSRNDDKMETHDDTCDATR